MVNRTLHIGTVAVLLGACAVCGERAAAAARHDTAIPRVFLPVVKEFARSPIPVYYPTWIPPYTFKMYSGKAYPLFCRRGGAFGVGPGYELGLYTERRVCDHAGRLFEIYGRAGDVYPVSTSTRPVWLGRSGWAYIDPDGNAGWTISFVRAVGSSSYPREYTYTVLGGCQEVGVPLSNLVGCLKRVAASVKRYAPGSRAR